MRGPTDAQKPLMLLVLTMWPSSALQHWQKRAGAVIDTAPANVERALPFVAAIGNHAAAAADTSVVEQQVDFVDLVTIGNLVAKPLDLLPVGDISDVRRDAQPLRQSRCLAEPLRFRQAGRRDVAHCDIAGFRHQLADQLAAHAAAAACDYRGPPREFGHVCSSLGLSGMRCPDARPAPKVPASC